MKIFSHSAHSKFVSAAFFIAVALITFQIQFAEAQWIQTGGPSGASVSTLAVSGSNIYAGIDNNGIYLSTDHGNTWTSINNGLPLPTTYLYFNCIGVNSSTLFAGTSSGAYYSTNNGSIWQKIASPIGDLSFQTIDANDSSSMIGSGDNAYYSNDNGAVWTIASQGLTISPINDIIKSDTNYIAGGDQGIYYTSNNGSLWQVAAYMPAKCFTIKGNELFAASYRILKSVDNGATWDIADTTFAEYAPYFSSFTNDGTNLYLGSTDGFIYKSSDDGVSWTQVFTSDGINSPIYPDNYINALVFDGTKVFAGMPVAGIFSSSDEGMNWFDSNNNLNLADLIYLANDGENLFAGTDGNGIFISSDDGDHWSPINNGLTCMKVSSIAIHDSTIFAGTLGKGVFVSNDNGATWTSSSSGLTDSVVNCLVVAGNNIYAGTQYGGVFLSSDNGFSWQQVVTGLTDLTVYSITSHGNDIFISIGSGTFFSSNNGSFWQYLTSEVFRAMTVQDSTVYGSQAMDNRIDYSYDYGSTWSTSFGTDGIIYALLTDDDHIFAGGGQYYGVGFYFTNDVALTWTSDNTGFPYVPRIRSLLLKDSTLYAGTNGLSVWKRNVGSFVGVNEISSTHQSEIFPNPSNGNLSFVQHGVSNQKTILTIRNSVGQIILTQTFTSEKNISIDLTHQPKGIYFATIFDGNKFSNEKIVVQ